MAPARCDATYEGQRCSLDHGHWPNTLHAATTPTSLVRWDPVEVHTWRRQPQPSVFKAATQCPICSKAISPRNYRERFCSDDCRKAARRDSNRRNKINVRRRTRRAAA